MSRGDSRYVSVSYPSTSPEVDFAVERLKRELSGRCETVRLTDESSGSTGKTDLEIRVGFAGEESGASDDGYDASGLDPEGFAINIDDADSRLTVSGADASGAMYGVLDLAEQIRTGGSVSEVEEREVSPEVGLRAVKFNLPWSAYRPGAQTDVHLDTCRDIGFWEEFLDMMAENRFNVLSLWNLHPFPFMVRTQEFPEACPFSEEELSEWKEFWRDLFRMAKDRGIETYIVNWNIVVSPEFAEAYDVDERNDTAEVVKEYTRESITAVIDEYEDLTGIGVSLCDWMKGLSPKEKQEWFDEAIVEGIRQANRSVKLLDRSVLTGSIDEMRKEIDAAAEHENVSEIFVPTKFNWSHGHSTTSLELTHDYDSGKVDDRLWDPEPSNYEISWMIRNEDFFVLRWGDPTFIREHIRRNYTGEEFVGGYFVGAEANIPAKDFSHELHRHKTWDYAFEKEWLFYKLWGRLLYDPETPDGVFEAAFEDRYGVDFGDELLEGFERGSQMPLKLASFHAGTWDYTLYSEGFLAPVRNEASTEGVHDDDTAFISINDLINHGTLDPSYLTIPEYVEEGNDSPERTTPLELADELEASGRAAVDAADSVRSRLWTYPGALECEVDDIETWGHLSLYFAEKLRGGVALESYRRDGSPDEQSEAVSRLESAAEHWEDVIETTNPHYREIPYATDTPGRGSIEEGNTFSWERYREDVERDIQIAKEG